MTPTAFAHLLDVHGPDLARWPEAERQAAAALLERSPAAQAALREARFVEDLLDHAAPRIEGPATAMVVALATARLQEARTPAVRRKRLWSVASWLPAGALAACLGLGLLLGATRPSPSTVSASEIVDLASGAGVTLGEEP